MAKQAYESERKGSLPVASNIMFMGGAGVGKSSIISMFFRNEFMAEYNPTVEEVYREILDADGRQVILNIFDTAGSYQFPAMKRIYLKKGDAFVLVYSVNELSSFDEVCNIRNEILKLRGESAPIVFVGNKVDLRGGPPTMSDVLRDATISIEWGNTHVECSASENDRLDQIFIEAIAAIRRRNRDNSISIDRSIDASITPTETFSRPCALSVTSMRTRRCGRAHSADFLIKTDGKRFKKRKRFKWLCVIS
ncbi:ras-related protein Rap-2c-like [Lineus longissimus]|uniref:ras-related protein Rap-2c-like n=1 Tax=Lineus longissimus TaxID=88925 RepID=UPI00315DDD88